MESAIHSGSDSIFKSFKKLQERPEIKQEVTKKDRLARLANSYSWKAVEEIIDGYIEHLTELRSVTEKDTVEAVGFRFLASQVAIEYLKNIKNLPKRARSATKQDE